MACICICVYVCTRIYWLSIIHLKVLSFCLFFRFRPCLFWDIVLSIRVCVCVCVCAMPRCAFLLSIHTCRVVTIWKWDLTLQCLQDTPFHWHPVGQIISGIPHVEAVEARGAASEKCTVKICRTKCTQTEGIRLLWPLYISCIIIGFRIWTIIFSCFRKYLQI